MTVVNPKSISGITSITTASGSDDLLSIHSNNGTERLRITSAGKISNNYDSTPANAQYGQLELLKNGVSGVDSDWSYLSFHRGGQIGWQQGIDSNDFVIASTSGSARDTLDAEKFRITTAGVVGIGTTAPVLKMHLHESSSGNNYLKFTNDTTGSTETDGVHLGLGSDEAFNINQRESNDIRLFTAATERFRIGSVGEMHIGTSSWPTGTMSKAAGRVLIGGGGDLTLWNETNSAGGVASFKLACKEGGDATKIGYVQFFGGTENTSDQKGFLKISVSAACGSGQERLRIDSSGNLGVGDNSPDVRLHVTETIDVGYTIDNTCADANQLLKLENPSSTANAFAGIWFRTGSGADLYFGSYQGSTNDGTFYWNNQNSSNQNLATLDSSTGEFKVTKGNLVIGTAGKGIDFGINSHAGGKTSELLDWYEEGTFTPTILPASSSSIAYTKQNGAYTRIGRLVTLTIFIQISSDTSSGAWSVGGFPFTVGNILGDTSLEGGMSGGYQNNSAGTNYSNIGFCPVHSSTKAEMFRVQGTSGDSAGLNSNETDSDFDFRATITYFV